MEGKGIEVTVSWGGQVRQRHRLYCIDDLTGAARRRALDSARQELYDWLEVMDLDGVVRSAVLNEMFESLDDVDGCQYLSQKWSLSYSQGDGVALSGKLHRTDKNLLDFPDGVDTVGFTMIGNYTHEHSFEITYYTLDPDWGLVDIATSTSREVFILDKGLDADTLKPQFQKFDDQVRQVCVSAERSAYQWIEDATGDEAAEDMLRSCDFPYRFDVDGCLLTPTLWADSETVLGQVR